MKEVPIERKIASKPHIQSYKDRIAYANEVRNKLGDDALAALAISAIRAFRATEWAKRRTSGGGSRPAKTEAVLSENANQISIDRGQYEEIPLPRQAYIIRQFKKPEEISLLRSVYGRQFILVSAYSPQEVRRIRISDLENKSRGGLISEIDLRKTSYELVVQDANENLEEHGQNVRDAFPLGDVFIDASSRPLCESTLKRFIYLLFGNNHITPTHEEYGMYMAKSASLRSSDLSRQVGAAIFRDTGEIITLGCNEVPKAGGGTYWTGDPRDNRDFVAGHDPNEQHKMEIFIDMIDRLLKGGFLSETLSKIADPYEIGQQLVYNNENDSIKESKIMDIIEFGRIIHAEMSAISDSARKGLSVQNGILYCTTFPCHLCAKHIVASGIKKVIYLEPYPKSYASTLHSDSIEVDGSPETSKVSFESFIGVSPYRYRDLFEKGKRKYSGGIAQQWNRGEARPMIEVYFPSYFEAETVVVANIREGLEKIVESSPDPIGDEGFV